MLMPEKWYKVGPEIGLGDEVTLVYFFIDGGDYHVDGIITHRPQGPGDLFELTLASGEVLAFNPYQYNLAYIIRAPLEEDKQ
jgi:hypothetical protein